MPADERDPETYRVIGAAMEVHSGLGQGFLEAVYHKSLAIEFALRDIPFVQEAATPIVYKGRNLDLNYRADFICFNGLLVEIKALSRLTPVEDAQVLNYLKATKLTKALLINFGAQSLEYKRIVRSIRA